MHNKSLRAQLITLCFFLIAVTVLAVLISAIWTIKEFNVKNIDQRLSNAENVFLENNQQKASILATAARVFSSDYGFRQLIFTRDEASIQSALDEQGQRINADIFIFSDTEGNLQVTNSGIILSKEQLTSLFEDLLVTPERPRFVIINDSLYQTILAPIKTGVGQRAVTQGYTILGFKIDTNNAQAIKKLTGLDVSFKVDERILFSTLSYRQYLNALDPSNENYQLFIFNLPEYANREITLDVLSGSAITVVLAQDLSEFYDEFKSLIIEVLMISTVIVLFFLMMSGYIVQSLTVPLAQLVKYVNTFSSNYQSRLTLKASTSKEIAALNDSFHMMSDRIVSREEEILYRAKHDFLTDLYNRSSILKLLQQRACDNEALLVVSFSIRRFSNINDLFGTTIGDKCLRQVAKRIKRHANEEETLHARIGGDEFLLVFNIEHTTDLESRLNELNKELKQPYNIEQFTINLTFTYGYSIAPKHANSATDLLRLSNIALENAIKENKTIRSYVKGENEANKNRILLLDQLQHALKLKQDLFMVYQPKVSCDTLKPEKLEALIRWNNDGEFISPEIFIEIAEQSGLILELTRWVISDVTKQLAKWNRSGIKIDVAINVSAQDISDDDFIKFVMNKLNEHAIKPHQITLELTERDIMDNEVKATSNLLILKELGFVISVDDYGIGQSSLSKLKALPIDELKIDKSFVMQLDESSDDQIIVQSTIKLAHSLGLSVVAEGIENQESLALLKDYGCNYGQGYHISRPLTVKDLEQWLTSYELA